MRILGQGALIGGGENHEWGCVNFIILLDTLPGSETSVFQIHLELLKTYWKKKKLYVVGS